jgi:hypothetical protein
MPAGFLTEDGPRPALAEAFGAVELPGASYATRRRGNVAEADAVLLFGDRTSPGAVGLIRDCRELGRPWVGDLRSGRRCRTVSKDHPGAIGAWRHCAGSRPAWGFSTNCGPATAGRLAWWSVPRPRRPEMWVTRSLIRNRRESCAQPGAAVPQKMWASRPGWRTFHLRSVLQIRERDGPGKNFGVVRGACAERRSGTRRIQDNMCRGPCQNEWGGSGSRPGASACRLSL